MNEFVVNKKMEFAMFSMLPFQALANDFSGGNEFFAYMSTSRFLNQKWNGSNYRVD